MLDPVTIRYAEALFNLARSRGALDAVRGDVERLSAELANPNVAGFFFDARVSVATRRGKLELVVKGMHPLTRNFVGLLFDKRREEVLKHVGEAFKRRVLQEEGRAEGVVESVRPLGSGELAELEVAMGQRLGKRVKLANHIVPELLGGVRVIVESRMLDSSLSGRLQGLEKRLLDAPLPTLQEI